MRGSQNPRFRNFAGVFVGVTVVAASSSLTGCSLLDRVPSLQAELAKHSGTAEIDLHSMFPDAELIALACPYSGAEVEALFGRDVLGNKDLVDTSNWLVVRTKRGAAVVEEMDRSEVDLCTATASVHEVLPGEILTFTQNTQEETEWELAPQ